MNRAPQSWAPPFCPNPKCRFHRGDTTLWRHKKIGFYTRKTPPYRIQRRKCDTCRRSFGVPTFLPTYWLHRPELLRPVFYRLIGCSGIRQIAIEFKASPETIARMAGRLGRHCLLFHQLNRPRGAVTEPLAADSFESFEFSQYHPTSFHVAAGKRSHFFYGFTDSEKRRSGTMTKKQRQKRTELEEALGRPDPRAVEQDFAHLLATVAPKAQELELHTDKHTDYPKAVKRVRHLRVVHRTVSSRAARTADNPLFPINLLDLLIRHASSNHKRETIAYSKRRVCAAERLALFLVWRNWMRPYSILKKGETPAMRLGISDHEVSFEELVDRRYFPTRIALPVRWKEYYRKTVRTRAIPRQRVHALKYAA
jgi:transposase-like protein